MLKVHTETTDTESAKVETPPAEPQSRFARLVREPLVHFVLAGAAIYLLFFLLGRSEGEVVDEYSIVISEGEVDSLAQKWQQKWSRAPTETELQGLIDQQVRETVLYREALALGLDADDVIIRRRMAQKLEFLAQDLIQPEPPTEDELKAWFTDNTDRYQPPDLITFTHVFMDPDKRGDDTLDDAKKLKEELGDKEPEGGKRQGDPFMLHSDYPERTEFEVAKLFGGGFAKSLMALETDKWHGPVLSGYGVHLVYVHVHQKSPPPEYDQVAEKVRQDWEEEKRKELNDQYVDSLMERYDVVVEGREGEAE